MTELVEFGAANSGAVPKHCTATDLRVDDRTRLTWATRSGLEAQPETATEYDGNDRVQCCELPQ